MGSGAASSGEVLYIRYCASCHGLDGRGEFIEAVFLEHFFDDGRVEQDFAGGRHFAVERWHHALANHAAQTAGHLAAHLFAVIGLEKFHDARDGLRGGIRVQGG